MVLSSVFAASAFLLLSARASDVCYGVTGNQDPTVTPCDPSASASSCCNYGDYCYSNGLCQKPGVTNTNATVLTIYGAHGCTEAGGSTGECYPFAHCVSKGVGITICPTANTYCCYGLHGCDCTNSTETFTLAAGTIITSLPASSIMSSTSSASATTSPTTSAAVSTTPVTSSAAKTASTNSVAIGVGVGVGVGVALLIAAGVGFWLWRRKRGAAASPVEKDADGSHGYPMEHKYASPAYATSGYSAAEQAEPYQVHPSEMDSTMSPVQLADTSKKPGQQGRSELA